MLEAFGLAYRQVNNLSKGIDIYQQLLTRGKAEKDLKTQEIALKNLGEMYLASFDYQNAAKAYEELLQFKRSPLQGGVARSQSAQLAEQFYLNQLAYIYTQALEPENAINYKNKLIENYLKENQPEKIAELKISLASDYESLNLPEKASENYQAAFDLAWSLQQLATASEALSKLANLYVKYEQNDYALEVYQELLKIEEKSNNLYGVLRVYDKIGDIYFEQNNYSEAIQAWKKGLEIAQILQIEENYFRKKIEEAQQKNK
jgi:tetratricopeptide (TPR) repeat protein